MQLKRDRAAKLSAELPAGLDEQVTQQRSRLVMELHSITAKTPDMAASERLLAMAGE